MVTQLGLSVMTPVFLCVFAGYYIDTHYGTRLILPLLVLGVLSGGRCGYVMAKNTFHVNEKQNEGPDIRRSAAPKQPAGLPEGAGAVPLRKMERRRMQIE